MTQIRLEPTIVCKRWATTSVVRPIRKSSSAFCTSRSDSESSEDSKYKASVASELVHGVGWDFDSGVSGVFFDEGYRRRCAAVPGVSDGFEYVSLGFGH